MVKCTFGHLHLKGFHWCVLDDLSNLDKSKLYHEFKKHHSRFLAVLVANLNLLPLLQNPPLIFVSGYPT